MAQWLRMDRRRCGLRIGLLLEIITVSIAGVGLWYHFCQPQTWFVGPLTLIAAALIPAMARGASPAELGLQWGRTREQWLLLLILAASICILTVVGLVLARQLPWRPPLVSAVSRAQWPYWVLFQFAYVALPEELFFRGYLLSRVNSLLTTFGTSSPITELGASLLSAGLFALAHMLLLSNPAGLLTFFPGLIFAWLFITMRSLLPPILMHAVANIVYALGSQVLF